MRIRSHAATKSSRKLVPVETGALALLAVLTGVTLCLRLYLLNSAPPWLSWVEAAAGLAARGLLHGDLHGYFLHSFAGGPLHAFLIAPFVAACDGQPFAVRLDGVILGSLEAPALYFLARRLWRAQPRVGLWAGLVAAGAWAASFWAQSINRTGSPVNSTPFLLTVAALAWLNWTGCPSRRRALMFGLLAGLTMLTSPAARVTLLLWPALFLVLHGEERRQLKSSLPWALLAFAAAAAPLLFYLIGQPPEPIARPANLGAVQDAGSLVLRAGHLPGRIAAVLGVFLGYSGDPLPQHNIPNRNPFSLVMAALFIVGTVAALADLRRRRQQTWLPVLWWLLFCLQAAVSAPNYPDFAILLPALPAALLLASWPVGVGADWVRQHSPDLLPHLALFVAVVLVVDGATTVTRYFADWRQETGLYTWFQGDVWSAADRALGGARKVVMPITEEGATVLDYAFARAPLAYGRVSAGSVENWLAQQLAAGDDSTVSTVVWDKEPYLSADAAQAIPFYLAREGQQVAEEPYAGYRIRSYRLGARPDFRAAGRPEELNATFGDGLKLTRARWGAAYPNADRSSRTAAAGTPFWAILSWQADAELKGKHVAVDLVDAGGRRLGSVDGPLLDAAQDRAGSWQPGTALTTYHLLDVPALQPAGPVSLEVRVYDAATLTPLVPPKGTPRASLELAQGNVGFATAAGPLPQTMRPVGQLVSPEVQLLGVDPWPGTVAPGETITFRLYWQLIAPLAEPRSLVLGLQGAAGSVTAIAPVAADTPVQLPQAALVDLRVPAELQPGTYPVWLAVDGQAGSQAEKRLELGELTIAGRPHVFARPAVALPVDAAFGNSIKLIGMDGPGDLQVTAGQPVTVTLAWQALGTPPTNLTRFLHALGPDGKLVAQTDSQPCSGACPVTSWLPGEVIVEEVALGVPADLAPGVYPLSTGWYDPAAPGMPRLAANDARGERVPGDEMRLPARLIVTR